ncbi:MAG: DNA-protecting protein DprA [Candidatus Omnitrophica bacterium]|nr:DNA-protecting protein DprA [Candidatus Omnitrophota bacterium]
MLNAPQDQLIAVSGIGGKIACAITSLKKEDIDREFREAHKLGLCIISSEDADYPVSLKNIPDPPIILYVKGELKKEDNLGVAIVGSRRASFYGLASAEKFSSELSERGFTIISGMARGIDTCAHRAAIKANGRTIAVMGSGFNNIYPPENKKLAQEISENGAVISEFPIDAPPLKEHFPQRNRTISGLALGVLVVEAAKNSGALITADFALEQGREVFAMPGKIDCSSSFGTNELIKQGAKLSSCTEDIIQEFNFSAEISHKERAIPAKQELDLSDKESVLFGLLSSQPLDLDEIIEKINMGIPDISVILLKLQIKKLIKELPGKQFVLSRPD